MNIIVYGAGAIGSLYGALLSEKNDVILIARKPHADAIHKSGLKITGVINQKYKINAQTLLKEIPEKTMLLIGVKVYDLEESLTAMKDKIKPDTILVLMQNGLGNEEIGQRILPKNLIVRAVVGVPVTFLKPGEIIYSAKTKTYLPDTREGRMVAKLFNTADIETETVKDFQRVIWTKLVVNCVFNPLTALLNIKNNKIRQLTPITTTIIQECTAVAQAEGIMIENIQEKVNTVIEEAGENLSSMLQDIMKHKKTEIDFLNGRIVELARKNGIAVPYNEMIVELLKFKENDYGVKSFQKILPL